VDYSRKCGIAERESPNDALGQTYIGPAIFDRDVLPLDIAGLLQALLKGVRHHRVTVSRCAVKKSNHRHRALLRPRGNRNSNNRAANKRHKFASSSSPFIGGGLNATQANQLSTRINAYMTALGINVY
jgi:hypothetical protein